MTLTVMKIIIVGDDDDDDDDDDDYDCDDNGGPVFIRGRFLNQYFCVK